MNNQEILPEPIPRPNEKHVEAGEAEAMVSEQEAAQVVEQQPGAAAGGAAISGVHVSSAQGQVGVIQGAGPAASSTSAGSAAVSAHLSADDLDLIEKEWVQKAKEIVESTQNDPHIQSDELSKVKADYIKKRYGRDVKVREG